MLSPALLKSVHVGLAAVSLGGFLLRGLWMLAGSDALYRRWVKVAPHVIDTALLATGVWMAWQLGISPLTHAWFGAKLGALILYIGAGVVALRPQRGRRTRVVAFLVAIGAAGYIVAVALSRTPLIIR